MEIPRGSVIVSRCSLKYIKDQMSCARRDGEKVGELKSTDVVTKR